MAEIGTWTFGWEALGAGGGFDPTQGNYRVEVAYCGAAGGQFTRTQLYVDPHQRVVGIGNVPRPGPRAVPALR